ncbi:hypothetical protein GQ53DRAFT_753784 [Thozetella sp. PMI_491]|nr:hypothetical protein GQ53DRAFT_753784 [Thozetella sp. PMI_491]
MTPRAHPVAKCLAALLLATGAAAQTSILPMFVLDSNAEDPFFLGASIVDVHAVSTAHTSQIVMTMSVDCLPGSSPQNDACRARSFYPAEIWHTQGSIFGGTVTARAEDSTTAYVCDLGSCGKPECGPSCILDITAGGSTRTDTITLDSCGLQQRSALLSVTANADKLPTWYYPTDSTKLISYWNTAGQSGSCARTTSAVASPTTALSTTAPPTNTPASSTQGGSQGQGSGSSSAATPTTSTNGSAAGSTARIWLQSVAAAGLCLAVSYL